MVSPFADGEYWYLVEPLVYDINETGHKITVPSGFVTDFASIPRPFWSLLPKWAEYGPPSVVHDYLYWTQQCERKQADKIFLMAMKESKVGLLRYSAIYFAVRFGGFFSYRENVKLRKAGHIRIMRDEDMPNATNVEDPHVTWKQYQGKLEKEKEIADIEPICNLHIPIKFPRFKLFPFRPF